VDPSARNPERFPPESLASGLLDAGLMIARRFVLVLAALALTGVAATPAHAGWLNLNRNNKKQQAASRAMAKKKMDQDRAKRNDQNKRQNEEWAKRQRVAAKAGKVYSSQVPSSNFKPVRSRGQDRTLSAVLGGSHPERLRESTMHQRFVGTVTSTSTPRWKFKIVPTNTPETGAPELFASIRY
jgi:hypothetical protein